KRAVTQAAFSPDGRLLITASTDRTARVWDAASGAAVVSPFEHGEPVQAAGFSGDGLQLFTLSYHNTGWERNVVTHEPMPLGLRGSLGAQSRGPTIPSRARTVTALAWRLPAEDRPVVGLAALAQLLSAHQLSEVVGDILPVHIVPVPRRKLREAWPKLRAAYRAELTSDDSDETFLAWHEREAIGSEI